jgi:glutathione S-transferase
VIGVIDSHLKKTGNPYLVGSRCTYADLAFVPWHWLLLMPPNLMGESFASEWERDFPHAWAWNQRLHERASVTKAREERKKAMGQ